MKRPQIPDHTFGLVLASVYSGAVWFLMWALLAPSIAEVLGQ